MSFMVIKNRVRVFATRGMPVAVFIALLGTTGISGIAQACGGFFCQAVPIAQAGEQIVFRQEGNSVTAMVRILYTGEAEDFSWVVPVPNAPELSVGSDTFFDQLEGQTRPQFDLQVQGESCPAPPFLASLDVDAVAESGEVADSDDSVMVTEEVVGPFDVQIITSDDASALATWLAENDYDLTDRGEELITPYVEENMQFVGLKLRSGQDTGSIQPLIMQYQADAPTIPIRLTAIAAVEDMGVLVWVVSDRRAVPSNYLHVIPNYGRVNWFGGPFNAFASYQGLITSAMNEAGGQGFATDFAGTIDRNVTGAFFDPDQTQAVLDQAASIANPADFIANVMQNIFQQQEALAYLQASLPLPQGFGQFVYFDAMQMQLAFTPEELSNARSGLTTFVQEGVIQPLRESIDLLPDGQYMTRLSTTLSADEMTLDPAFAFNPSMGDQARTRRATLDLACTDGGTEWQLTLGEGTEREGEVVAQGVTNDGVPFSPPVEILAQRAIFRAENTSDALPVAVTTNDFVPVSTGGVVTAFDAVDTTPVDPVTPIDEDDTSSSSSGGSGGTGTLLLSILALIAVRRKQLTVR